MLVNPKPLHPIVERRRPNNLLRRPGPDDRRMLIIAEKDGEIIRHGVPGATLLFDLQVASTYRWRPLYAVYVRPRVYEPGDVLPHGTIQAAEAKNVSISAGVVWVTVSQAAKAARHGWRLSKRHEFPSTATGLVAIER
jgi:hypothetical protein